MLDTVEQRIKHIRKQMNLSQTSFGEPLCISQAAIGQYEKGVRGISLRLLKQISQEYKVSLDWLRYGEGEMFINDSSTVVEKLAKELNMTQREMNVLTVFLKFPPEDRQKIMDYGEKFVTELIKQRKENEQKEEKVRAAIEAEVEAYRKELEAEYRSKGKLSALTNSDAEKNGKM